MRVLHCHSGNLFGGVERALLALSGLTSPESRFALCFEERLAATLASSGNTPHSLGPVRFCFPWSTWRARRRLDAVLGAERFDWILVHSLWSLRLAYPVARRQRVPIAFWAHDRVDPRHRLTRMIRGFAPDRLFANSQFTAKGIPLAFPGRWPEILPPPLDRLVSRTGARARIRRELGTPEGAVVVLCLARFDPLKGQDELLAAVERLNPNWKGEVWLGGIPQRPFERAFEARCRERAGRLKVTVRFLGMRDDRADLYEACDLYCQANTGPEAFGLSFAEALRAGRPVITTAVGAAPEIVDEHVGRLTPTRDPSALARAIEDLSRSADLRDKLGRSARERGARLLEAGAVGERLMGFLEGRLVPRRMVS